MRPKGAADKRGGGGSPTRRRERAGTRDRHPRKTGTGQSPEDTRKPVQTCKRQRASRQDQMDDVRGAAATTPTHDAGRRADPARPKGAGGTRAPRRLPDRREGIPRRIVGNLMEPVGYKTMPVSRSVAKADGTPISRTPKGLRAYGLNAKGGPRRGPPVALRP